MKRVPQLGRVALWAPVLGCITYVGLFVAFLKGFLAAAYWSSDTAAPLLIAQRIAAGRVRGGTTWVTQPIYVAFNLLTRHLPASGVIWKLTPLLIALATAGLLVWTVAQIATPWAAGLAGSLAIAVSPRVLNSYLAQSFHGTTWFGTALLAALVVHMARRDDPLRIALAVSVSVVIGVLAASDPLLVVTGIAPLFLVSLLLLVVSDPRQRSRATYLAIVGAASLAIALGTRWNFVRAGYVVPPSLSTHWRLATPTHWPKNLRLFAHGWVDVLGGPFRRVRFDLLGCVIVASAVVATVGIVLGVRLLRRSPDVFAGQRPLARWLFAAFWCSSLVLVVVSFLASQAPIDAASTRYLIPVLFASAALAPVAVEESRRLRIGASVAFSVVIAAACANLVALHQADAFRSPNTTALPVLIRFLESHQLLRGYGDYWDANAVSWQTRDRFMLLPVKVGCRDPDRDALCPYLQNVSDALYVSKEPGGSFVVADPQVQVNRAPSTRIFGPPRAVFHVDRFVVYVYPYDVETRFVPDLAG